MVCVGYLVKTWIRSSLPLFFHSEINYTVIPARAINITLRKSHGRHGTADVSANRGPKGFDGNPMIRPFFSVKIQIHFLLFNIQFLRAKCSMSFWFTSAIFLIKIHVWFVKIHFFGLQVQFSSLKFPFCGLNMIKLHSSVAPSCGGAFWLAVQTPFFLREVLQGGMVSQSFVEISIRYHYKMYMRAFV